MPSTTTRRTLLAAAGAGLAAALAGCSASESHESPPDDGTLVTDHTAATTRSPDEDPPIVRPREAADGGVTTDTAAPEPISLHTVESREGAETFAFAEDATNAAAVRRLLAETNYDEESVFVYQTVIGECYRLRLNYVARDADGGPDLQFCRVIRDAHTACDREASDHAAAFVRLPFPGDEYSGLSAGFGGSCDRIPEPYRNGSDSA